MKMREFSRVSCISPFFAIPFLQQKMLFRRKTESQAGSQHRLQPDLRPGEFLQQKAESSFSLEKRSQATATPKDAVASA